MCAWFLFSADPLHKIVWRQLMKIKKWGFGAGWILHSLHSRYQIDTMLCMIGNNCCLLQLFADKIAAVRIPASGTRARFTKEIAFQDSTHFALDACIHNADLKILPSCCFSQETLNVSPANLSRQCIFVYRLFLSTKQLLAWMKPPRLKA